MQLLVLSMMVLHVKQVSPSAIPQMCILVFTLQAPPSSQSCTKHHFHLSVWGFAFERWIFRHVPSRRQLPSCRLLVYTYALLVKVTPVQYCLKGKPVYYMCVCSCRRLIKQPAVPRCLRSPGITSRLRALVDDFVLDCCCFVGSVLQGPEPSFMSEYWGVWAECWRGALPAMVFIFLVLPRARDSEKYLASLPFVLS